MQQCASSLLTIVASMLNENTKFCRDYLGNPDFMNAVNTRVFDTVYSRAVAYRKSLDVVPLHNDVVPYMVHEEDDSLPMAAESDE